MLWILNILEEVLVMKLVLEVIPILPLMMETHLFRVTYHLGQELVIMIYVFMYIKMMLALPHFHPLHQLLPQFLHQRVKVSPPPPPPQSLPVNPPLLPLPQVKVLHNRLLLLRVSLLVLLQVRVSRFHLLPQNPPVNPHQVLPLLLKALV